MIVPVLMGGRPAWGFPRVTKKRRLANPITEPIMAPQPGMVIPAMVVVERKTLEDTTRMEGMIISPIPMINAPRSPESSDIPSFRYE
jgi:hypothetical protein